MEIFLSKALKKIRKESPRRLKHLITQCDNLIEYLADPNCEKVINNELPDKYFEPLKIACESKLPRLMEVALDSFHYMMEHGFFRGDWQKPIIDESDPKQKSKTRYTSVILMMNACADEPDDGVQLQVIKALLTAVTSAFCEVHEQSLLLCIRTCFNIHLMSKNAVNKATARAALTQMLSAVNQRMEKMDLKFRSSLSEKEIATIEEETLSSKVNPSGTLTDTVNTESAVVSENGQSIESLAPEIADETKEAAASTIEPSIEATPAMTTNTEDHSSTGGGGDQDTNDTIGDSSFPSIMHKDAFLVFRALCKLSMKGLNESEPAEMSDQIALQNRLLSLELILHCLQQSGPAFRSGDKFIQVIRQQLCVSLLRNCTSQLTQVTGISLQIFVCLMDGFKDHLKRELEVFVAKIFIRILESENATFEHKMSVLEVFHIICTEPSAMVEIFINYDCDMDATDLFRRIVDGFSKITKNPTLPKNSQSDFMSSSSAVKRQTDENNIKIRGLQGLVIILRTLLKTANLWQNYGEMSQHTDGNGNSTISNINLRRDAMSNPYSVIASISFEPSDTDKTTTTSTTTTNTTTTTTTGALPSSSSSTDIKPSVSNPDMLSPLKGGGGGGAGGENGSSSTSIDNSSVNVVEMFDRKKKMQEELETGIMKFNLSPKQGLKYLAENGHLEHTPQGVAKFLHQYQHRLDKTATGDYLGREREYENGFCIQVLHEYVELLDFTGMKFDSAIRLFLSGFRLPGEAQKIDRLMEKFAERYYLLNRDDFASADMAFILAFSTIMLQTNLHNPAIREDKRMTKEQFIRQNKGISQDGELADELLIEIYDRISAQPISIATPDNDGKKVKKEEPPASSFSVFQSSTNDKRRKEAFDDERKEMVRTSEEIFKTSNRKDNIFLRTGYDSRSDEAYAKPMFEVSWPPILGVLSQVLETHDDPALTDLCLSAFRFSIRLACRLDVPTARNTFMNALTKFTTLDTVKAMEHKHIETIKTFIDIVLIEGDWLDETWNPVLQTTSQLARLQLFADGSQIDDVFVNDTASVTSADPSSKKIRRSFSKANNNTSGFQSNFDQFTKLFSGPSRAEILREVEEANSQLVAQEIDSSLIDKIYVNSHMLSEGSVYHFVKSLCEVSMLEIAGGSAMTSLRGKDSAFELTSPRVFSLQKLVEVAEFNIGSRPRIVWANIWTLLAKHFTSVCMSDNLAVAMYGVDSLKQLSIKFLQKDELSNFNFQRVFLKPYEVILSHSKSFEIKDLILHCIDNMILASATNIRSGWKSIFSMFEVASHDQTDIASIAFTITERLVMKEFELLVNDYVELINCLVAYVASHHTELSMKALDLIAYCSKYLVTGIVNTDHLHSHDTKHHHRGSTYITSGSNGASGEPHSQIDPASPSASAESNNTTAVTSMVDEDSSVFRLWWPLLLGLSTAVGDQRLTVRVKALETLGKVLHEQGMIFSPQAWGVIFKGILFPMIDSAKTDSTPQTNSMWPTQNPAMSGNRQSWIGTMAIAVFNMCIELFREYEERASPVLTLIDILNFLEDCINQETETLARMAVKVYHDLVKFLSKPVSEDNTVVSLSPLSSTTADLICNRICKLLRQNLCIDYGELGYLEFVEDTPSEIADKFTECPVQTRRKRNKGDDDMIQLSSNPESCVTPYGNGSYEKVVERNEQLGVEERLCIQLEWGGRLYTVDKYIFDLPTSTTIAAAKKANGSNTTSTPAAVVTTPKPLTSPKSPLSNSASSSSTWPKFANAAMCSMVITLELLKVITDCLNLYKKNWNTNHLQLFLNTLETSYWHARSFNESLTLRKQLYQKKFMQFKNDKDLFPHLLEQEIYSLSLIQLMSTKFYLTTEDHHDYICIPIIELQVFSQPWFQRFGALIFQHYILLDLGRQVQHTNAVEESTFTTQKLEAYSSCTIELLDSIMHLNEDSFIHNLPWLASLLSQMILSDNRNIRYCLSRIYAERINALLSNSM